MTMFFRVKNVVVTGLDRYTPGQIQAAAGVSDGDNMFFLNKYAMAAQIERELPYIEEIRISRDLPDTLNIDVTECGTPLAVVQGGSAWLVSPAGKIVDRVEMEYGAEYGQITGCELLSPAIGTRIALATEYASQRESLIALMGALREADLMEQVDGIRLEDLGCIRMDYAGRFTVKLLYGADYPQKLRALSLVLEDPKIQENMTGTFDLTRDDKINFQQNVR